MKVYDLGQLANLLGMNRRVLQSYVRNGKLKASKIGRKYIVTDTQLKAFLKANEKTKK